METFYIMINHSHVSEGGYNLTWGGEGSSGYTFTDEQKKRCSEGHLGISPSEQTLIKRSKSMKGKNKRYGKDNNRYGVPHTKDTKDKQRLTKIGDKCYWYEKHFSEEHKNKISMGVRKYSDEIIENMISFKKQGLNRKQISMIMNIPQSTIYGYIKDVTC
jgi:hypothetical protein